MFLGKSLHSQRTYYLNEKWEASIYGSANSFYGDLSEKSNRMFNNTPFSKFYYLDRQFGGGFTLEKKINPYFGAKGNLYYSGLKGTRESKDQYFKGWVFEYSLLGTVDMSNLFMGQDRYRKWSIYGYWGLGFTESRSWKYNLTTGDLLGTNGLQKTNVEGKFKPMTETIMPIGIGYNYKFAKKQGFFIEMSFRPINTDKLDVTISTDNFSEGFGTITFGFNTDLSMPRGMSMFQRKPRYNGKSSEPAIKAYNSKRHVIMKTKSYKKASKKRYKLKRKRVF